MFDAEDQQLLLAARPPSRLQRRWAYCVMACLLAVFCITAPYASLRLPIVTAFLPIQVTVVVVNNLITAALIVAQFWVVRWTWLLVLASGYLFTALISVPFVLTFPGVFAPTGLLGAGRQTAFWISACLHMGLPIFLIIAMLVRTSGQTTNIYQRSPGSVVALSIALVTAIVCGLTWASLEYDEILPQIFVSFLQSRSIAPVVVPIVALDAIALLQMWRRGRSVLDLWLMIMCSAWLFDISLGPLIGGNRYSLGWYTARTFQTVAAFVVLLLFLSEKTALYANLARAAKQRRGAQHARQIAIDATAASIGHEINQPLTALITNGNAGLLLVAKAEPDWKEAHAIFSDMVAEGQRIGQIVGSVRTMFKKSTHDRQQLNLNTVVRDVLSTVELDLQLQRVTVKMDLNNDLPSVLADSGQLHQVFLNLVTNATEAMTGVTGRACVLTVTSGIAAGSSDLAVTVEDTGGGIAAKDSDHIFEPFYSTKAAGSGVGLTICRVIVEAHGGRLETRANHPHGTIFRVTLPMGTEE